MAVLIKYWPAVVAGLYLLYVLAAGKVDQIQPAVIAFIAAFGLNHTSVRAFNIAADAHDLARFGPRPLGKGYKPRLDEIE